MGLDERTQLSRFANFVFARAQILRLEGSVSEQTANNIELILPVGQIGLEAEEIVDVDDVGDRRGGSIDVGHAPVAIKFCSIAKRRDVPIAEIVA